MDSLVKAELRARIQLQRLMSGQEELTVDYPSTPSYELTPEEKIKLETRRRNNRLAASKSRKKKKELQAVLEKRYRELCIRKSSLEKEAESLRKQVRKLQKSLIAHKCCFSSKTCNCLESENFEKEMTEAFPLKEDVHNHLQFHTEDVGLLEREKQGYENAYYQRQSCNTTPTQAFQQYQEKINAKDRKLEYCCRELQPCFDLKQGNCAELSRNQLSDEELQSIMTGSEQAWVECSYVDIEDVLKNNFSDLPAVF